MEWSEYQAINKIAVWCLCADQAMTLEIVEGFTERKKAMVMWLMSSLVTVDQAIMSEGQNKVIEQSALRATWLADHLRDQHKWPDKEDTSPFYDRIRKCIGEKDFLRFSTWCELDIAAVLADRPLPSGETIQ